MTPQLPKDKPDLRKKLHDLPHKPGVYLMRDRLNRVIYVGKARDLRKRVSQYFMESKKRTADPKTRALLESVWNLEWHTVRSEPEALLLEGKLIKEFRPKYNVAFRDDKRFLMVKVDMAEEWPRFRLARFKREDNARYFGPYADAGALRHTLRFMRKRFGILTFGRGAPNEQELKSSSFQVHMKISGLNPGEYRQKVEQACEFIAGQSKELLAEIEAEMHKAAEKLDFERAAELRNMLEDLRATMAPSRRFTRFTRNTLPSTVLPEADLLALKDALQLTAPPKVMECFDISNISTTHIVASMVCFRDGVPDIANYRRYRIKTVDGQNDFASMAEVVRRRYSRILLEARESRSALESETPGVDLSAEFSQEPPAEAVERLHRLGMSPVRLPDLIIVDGGKGQLSSACKELQRLGLHELPIIGLAKEFEEIYRPGRPVPLLLPEDSGALRLLQRIRDEAHRFANGYHQLLMKRRIAESLLDDCPGVSATRKQALLQKFGSVARLR
ncbi:MAG: excinuclease ABC subunit UvrC, partial [Verrucomicrobia bacterium]|nr:excinuclease ABC subunit UvrC [Verrucomicrobiota bacterium]